MRKVLVVIALLGGVLALTTSTAGAATFTPPSPLDFGSVQVGAVSPGRTVTIQGATFPGGFDVISSVSLVPGSAFSITATTCNTTPPPSSCTVTITFAPIGAGPASGTLNGSEMNPATGGSAPFTYTLAGTGTSPPPELPEVPAPWLLPLVASGLFGASFLILRRRATAAANGRSNA